jgi:hypothetical protein
VRTLTLTLILVVLIRLLTRHRVIWRYFNNDPCRSIPAEA